MRPADVLQRHVDLHETLADVHGMQTMIATMVEQDGRSRESGYEVARAIRRHLETAETYIVEASMNDEILRCTEHDIDGRVPFGQQMAPPSHSGFLVFAEPLVIREIRSRKQLIHTITWGTTLDARGEKGMLITFYNDTSREPDEVILSGLPQVEIDVSMQICAGWSVVLTQLVSDQQKPGPSRIFPTPEKVKEVVATGIGRPLYEGHVNFLHLVLATWKLMSETIDCGEARTEYPDRPTARRAKRANVNKPEITVVTLRRLRRRTMNPGNGEPLKWRSTVKEHYRNQAWGPGRQLRRRILIEEHERGPEDAPHKPAKPKVIRLTR